MVPFCAQSGDYDLACEKLCFVKSEYHDLLVLPENDDFVVELDSRLACALVDSGKYSKAVPIFESLFKRAELEDKQRFQVFFGLSLLRVGRLSEGKSLIFNAMRAKMPSWLRLRPSIYRKADPH